MATARNANHEQHRRIHDRHTHRPWTRARGHQRTTDGRHRATHDQARIAALLDRYETALNASDVDAVVEIEVHGDLAFARTGSKGTVRILADGTSAPEENRELFVFEKHRGEWKIARYIFNKTS